MLIERRRFALALLHDVGDMGAAISMPRHVDAASESPSACIKMGMPPPDMHRQDFWRRAARERFGTNKRHGLPTTDEISDLLSLTKVGHAR